MHTHTHTLGGLPRAPGSLAKESYTVRDTMQGRVSTEWAQQFRQTHLRTRSEQPQNDSTASSFCMAAEGCGSVGISQLLPGLDPVSRNTIKV